MTENNRVIVAGGAGGIGGAVCRELAALGYQVTIADVDPGRASSVLQSLKGEGHDVVQMDATKDSEVDTAFDEVEARSPARVLVIAFGGPISDSRNPPNVATMTTADWNKSIAYNLSGFFFCMRKFGQLRQANRIAQARIITLSSGLGQFPGAATDFSYGVCKAAIIGMTRQAAFDLLAAGVTVNSVAPGPIATEELLRHTDEQMRTLIASDVLMKRLGSPEEVSAGVAFLASPQSSYVTGTTLDVNGGAHMH